MLCGACCLRLRKASEPSRAWPACKSIDSIYSTSLGLGTEKYDIIDQFPLYSFCNTWLLSLSS